MSNTALFTYSHRYAKQKGIDKYIRMREFRDRYALEILEYMKAVEDKNLGRARTTALRIFEAAKIFRDTRGNGTRTAGRKFRFDINRSCSYSRFYYAYDYKRWEKWLPFFTVFLYPYPIPEALIWTAFEDEGFHARENDYDKIINLAKKWTGDITSGCSFYERNKTFFTRLEAHYFLSEKIGYSNVSSLVRRYFLAKYKARKMNIFFSDMVSNIFASKFVKHFDHILVTEFLDLLARTTEKQLGEAPLDDICDFVLSKIERDDSRKEKTQAFSFSGRTLRSVMALMHQWHTDILGEFEATDIVNDAELPGFLKRTNYRHCKWYGMGIENYTHETDNCTWVISELRTSVSLFTEGQRMKNCVSYYTQRCVDGECAIFNVSCRDKKRAITESAATLEVHPATKRLIQAKAKCNAGVTDPAMNVITQWAKDSGITVDLI
jgi:hypothetical protein